MGFWPFLKQHPFASVSLVISSCISVGSRVNDAYALFHAGLPSQIWEAIGLGLFLLTVVVLLFRWRSEAAEDQQKPLIEAQDSKNDAQKTEPDPIRRATSGDAHERLDLFIIDFLTPALSSQIDFQEAILKRSIKNDLALELAQRGLVNDDNHWEFCEAYKLLQQFDGSPMPTVSNGQMIDCIIKLENNNYKRFCAQAAELAKEAGIDIKSDPELYRLWDVWRGRHNALVDAYDGLKRESRFGPPLYRPQLASRWE